MRVGISLVFLAASSLLTPQATLGFSSQVQNRAVGRATVILAKAAPCRRAAVYKRRHNWTRYPYWRPYQYRYWQFYYPYGGPLFWADHRKR